MLLSALRCHLLKSRILRVLFKALLVGADIVLQRYHMVFKYRIAFQGTGMFFFLISVLAQWIINVVFSQISLKCNGQ